MVSGAAGAIGYGIGVFAVWLVRYMRSKDSQPARAALGLAGACSSSASSARSLAIIWFHVWQDDVRDFMGVPRLRFLGPSADRGAVDRLPVRLRRDRPARRQAGALPGPAAGSRCAAAGFGRRGRRRLLLVLTIALLNGVVVRVAMEQAQQHPSRRSTTRRIPNNRRADDAVAFGRPAVAGQLGRRSATRAASSSQAARPWNS